MNFKINSDNEALKFLMSNVYNNGGEFRIHTNKEGLRLYLRFTNQEYTGQIYQYYTGLGYTFHKDLRRIIERKYCDTLVGKTLQDVLNKHLKKMSGFVLIDDDYLLRNGTDVSTEMSIEEFVKNDLEQRRQPNRFNEVMMQLKNDGYVK